MKMELSLIRFYVYTLMLLAAVVFMAGESYAQQYSNDKYDVYVLPELQLRDDLLHQIHNIMDNASFDRKFNYIIYSSTDDVASSNTYLNIENITGTYCPYVNSAGYVSVDNVLFVIKDIPSVLYALTDRTKEFKCINKQSIKMYIIKDPYLMWHYNFTYKGELVFQGFVDSRRGTRLVPIL